MVLTACYVQVEQEAYTSDTEPILWHVDQVSPSPGLI